jgi:hypothetical protein
MKEEFVEVAEDGDLAAARENEGLAAAREEG